MTKALVAVAQMMCGSSIKSNLESFKRLVVDARTNNAKMVFFPENTDFMTNDPEKRIELAQNHSELAKEYANTAKENNIWISIGGYHEVSPTEPSKMYNTQLVIDNNGKIVEIYRKTHLFIMNHSNEVINEANYFIAGKNFVKPLSTPVGTLGFSSCFELRFPRIAEWNVKHGANILLYPSAFTFTTGAAHWEVLLRARAIENQCYVIAAAQCGGLSKSYTTYGHSMIIDPWGCIIAQCSDGAGISLSHIDSEFLEQIRKKIPMVDSRRDSLYDQKL